MEPEALNLGCADGPYPRSFFGCGEAADNSSRRLEASVIDPEKGIKLKPESGSAAPEAIPGASIGRDGITWSDDALAIR